MVADIVPFEEGGYVIALSWSGEPMRREEAQQFLDAIPQTRLMEVDGGYLVQATTVAPTYEVAELMMVEFRKAMESVGLGTF